MEWLIRMCPDNPIGSVSSDVFLCAGHLFSTAELVIGYAKNTDRCHCWIDYVNDRLCK